MSFKAVNIRKKYGKSSILKGISLEAGPGERICIQGRNGSGKTTLLRILGGALHADEGEISLFGETTGAGIKYRKPALFGKYCGYVPQEDPLMPDLCAGDNLKLWGCPRGEVQKTLEDYGLKDMGKKPVSKLSGGMKRRVSIAIALMKKPKILILDEPTSALDIAFKEEMSERLMEFTSSGGIIIMSSHDRLEIERSDRVLRLEEGVFV